MAGNQGQHLVFLNKSRRGMPLSEQHREKISKSRMGQKWNDEMKLRMSINYSGSKNPNYKNGDKIAGDKNPNWRGGTTRLSTEIRLSKKYKAWILEVYKRDNFTCQRCGATGSDIFNAHHIKRFAQIIRENDINNYNESLACEALWNIENGLTLCKPCHKKEHYEFA